MDVAIQKYILLSCEFILLIVNTSSFFVISDPSGKTVLICPFGSSSKRDVVELGWLVVQFIVADCPGCLTINASGVVRNLNSKKEVELMQSRDVVYYVY